MSYKKLLTGFEAYENTHLRGSGGFIIIASLILTLSIARGLIVIFFGGAFESVDIYNLVFLVCLIYTIYCFFDQQRLQYPQVLRLFLYLNLIFYTVWFLPEILATQDIKFFLVCSTIPFAMFGFMKIPSKYFIRLLIFFLFLLSFTTIIDFVMSNIPSLQLRDYREELRLMINPDQKAPTRVGILLRTVGITGSEHETSCLLAMLVAFVLALEEKHISKKTRSIAFYLGLIAIGVTLSTANTVVALVSIVLITFYYFRRKRYFQTILVVIPAIIFIFYLSLSFQKINGNVNLVEDLNFIDAIWVKISPTTGNWGTLLTTNIDDSRMGQEATLVCYYWQKGCSYIFNEFGGLIIGHQNSTKMAEFGRITEIGLLRMMWETGLTSFLCFLLVLFFPIILYFNSDTFTRKSMFPYFCALTTGIFTLLHYGAIFRTTNIFLFYALYGACIRQYIISINFKQKFVNKVYG
tara:strand:+ start:171 stop:1565 length:1395 start_codon:yes stop_codon:yes gene_type:complete